MSLKVVSVSPVLFWVQQFLEASWAATNSTQSSPSAAFGESLWSSYGHSQMFSEVPLSLFVLQSIFSYGPPHAEHQKLFVPSAEQRSKPLFSKDNPDTAKAGNLFQVFLWISVSSPHALQAFPHRCPGSFHLIKMHMQQREISKSSDLTWCEMSSWSVFCLPADYRGRHR